MNKYAWIDEQIELSRQRIARGGAGHGIHGKTSTKWILTLIFNGDFKP